MIFKVGFSPCPNDTFIFDALVHKKIDTQDLNFSYYIADVEDLNKKAFNNELDITKISYHAYALISEKYKILNSGSALGYRNGPLLVSKKKVYPDEVNDLKIGIPGKNTTANLLLSIAYPKVKSKIEYLFSDIEEAVLSNEVDAGLIIHENRFTYKEKGLKKIIDLGEYWEKETDLPIPLGGIIIKRDINEEIQMKFNRILKASIEFAFKNPNSSIDYIKKNSQELDDDVIKKHIELYVNKFSLDLGQIGKNAIKALHKIGAEKGIIQSVKNDIFVE